MHHRTLLAVALTLVVVALASPTVAGGTDVDDTPHVSLTASSEYASTDGGTLTLDFDRLSKRAVTDVDVVFELTVTDASVDGVWIESDLDGLTFYADGDRTRVVDTANPLTPAVGETVTVGVSVDTRVTSSVHDTVRIHVSQTPALPDEPKRSAVSLTSVGVSPTELETGESIVASATYVNRGEASGLAIATLRVDGVAVDRERVRVGPGERETVRFERLMETPGRFEVGIGGRETTVNVTRPDGPAADIVLTETTLEPESLRVGETLVVTGTYENRGEVAGSKTAEFGVGDAVVETKRVDLEPGEQATVRFEWRFEETGTYAITVDGVAVGPGSVSVASARSVVLGSTHLQSQTAAAVALPLAVAVVLTLATARRRVDLWAPWWRSKRD
ncbi:CARDB domain-containing protein [Natronobiforma cellulositropha]|uniref:CARDB domain-containing protein n=1 Tax=Natronobiforma cellulositropha TaxID=1679076 RepID=UPI0021D5ABFC|nr:CARDB domain-containing protein [Natronobiforma cellulositropha]